MLVFAYLVAVLTAIGLLTIVNSIEQSMLDRAEKKKRRAHARNMRAWGLAVIRDFRERERKREFMKNVYEWGNSLSQEMR